MSLQLKISIAPEKHLLNSNAQIPRNGITDHRCDTAAQTHTVLCPHYSLSEVGAVRSRPRPAQLTARQHRRARSPPPPHSTPQRGGLAVVLDGRGVPSCHGAVLCCAVLCCAVLWALPAQCPAPAFIHDGSSHRCSAAPLRIVQTVLFPGHFFSPCLSPAAVLIRSLLTCVLSALRAPSTSHADGRTGGPKTFSPRACPACALT